MNNKIKISKPVFFTGNSGEIFTGILDGTASNVAWTDVTNFTVPLPLQDIEYSGSTGTVYAAGTDGKVLQRQSSGNWKTLTTGITKNINRIYFASATNGVIAGDQGLLSLFAVSGTAINNGMLPVNNGPVNENLHDVILSGVTAYVAGENGTVLYTPDVINTPFAITNQNTSNDFYGLALKPSSTQVYAIGENSKIHWCIGASRTVVKNVFTPTLKDVHFADLNHGTLAGDNFTLRQTHDGGVTWEVILPNNTTAGKVINRVWTINGNYALAIGDSKYLSAIENNIATEQPNSLFPGAGNNFLAIAFNTDQPLKGYIAGNQRRLRGITLTPSGSSFTISMNNAIAQPVFTAPTIPNTTEIRALHVFDNNSVMAVGNNNFIGYYNTSAWVDVRNNSLPATTVYNDVYFHDHYNGYAVGNNGTMLRSTNTSLNPTTGYLTGTTWQQKSIVDGFNITANSQANIIAIAFASRYNGVWGGNYNITNTSNKPYVRLIRDESELFSTYFWYDKLGRIVVSQTTKQHNSNQYSYTVFDELGIAVEVGVKTENNSSVKFNTIFGSVLNGFFESRLIDDSKLLTWINDTTGSRNEVKKSYYTEIIITGLPTDFNPNPLNLRKKITHITYEELFDDNDQTYDFAIHYDYDVHGSIKTVLQDNQKMANTNPILLNQRFKRIDYTYDLISGNVNKVEYQKNEADEWNHRFEHDGDNRLTQVETSPNDILWDKDVQYKYYSHWPIARMELGDNQVQGVDYTFNLQRWVKGVNSNTLSETNDPGKDGNSDIANNANKNFARDIYGYTLGYFTNDYKSIDVSNHGTNSFTASIAGSDVEANRNDLFNGNIGSMITTITNPTTREILPLGNAYKYDQLNRLLQAVSYDNLDINHSSATFNSFGSGGTQMYYNAFTFDANGNIQTQTRKDHLNNPIDNLQYRYAKDVNGKTIQNRLYHVNDDTDYDGNDIDDMGLFEDDLTLINQNNNYVYNEIGQLIKDKQEGIENIIWNSEGRIKEVIRLNGDIRGNIKFDYDGLGNRVAKHVFKSDNLTPIKSNYYFYDAQGYVIAIYEEKFDSTNQTIDFALIEREIYGFTRVGINSQKVEMIAPQMSEGKYVRELGYKNFELTNHLNDVLAVITDKKIPIENSLVSGEVAYFEAEILTASDYSPFGTILENRDYTSEKYRYGFQGQEKDDEVKGKSNSYNFSFRIYDPRLGRFMSTDPFAGKYANNSPYCFSQNIVIAFIEFEGAEAKLAIVFETKAGEFNQNANALKEQGYDVKIVKSGKEAIEVIDSYKGKEKFESVVILSHGYEGGIVGGSENSGVYTQTAWAGLAMWEGQPNEENDPAKDIDPIWKFYTGIQQLNKQGAVTASMLGRALKDVGFTSDGELVLAGCNLAISGDVVKQRKEDYPLLANDESEIFQTGGFAGELAYAAEVDVVASSAKVIKNGNSSHIQSGLTSPKKKENSTLRFTDGKWVKVTPFGSTININNGSQTIDLTNPYNKKKDDKKADSKTSGSKSSSKSTSRSVPSF